MTNRAEPPRPRSQNLCQDRHRLRNPLGTPRRHGARRPPRHQPPSAGPALPGSPATAAVTGGAPRRQRRPKRHQSSRRPDDSVRRSGIRPTSQRPTAPSHRCAGHDTSAKNRHRWPDRRGTHRPAPTPPVAPYRLNHLVPRPATGVSVATSPGAAIDGHRTVGETHRPAARARRHNTGRGAPSRNRHRFANIGRETVAGPRTDGRPAGHAPHQNQATHSAKIK
jgi:hypothetical protein